MLIKTIVNNCTDIIKDLQMGINSEKRYLEKIFRGKFDNCKLTLQKEMQSN